MERDCALVVHLHVASHYLEEENLSVLLKVQSCINVRWDPGQLLGVAKVKQEVCVAPNFITCRREENDQN